MKASKRKQKTLKAQHALILRVGEVGGVIDSILVSHPSLPAPRWFIRATSGKWYSMVNGRVGDTPVKKWYVLDGAINEQVKKHDTTLPVKITDFSRWAEGKRARSYVAQSERDCVARSHRTLFRIINQTRERTISGKVVAELA